MSERARRGIWAGALLLVAAGIGAYSNSFHAPFVFDDLPTIRDNPAVRALGESWKVSPDAGITSSGRPLVGLSFALNYAWGGLRVESFHALNLLIHLGAALALFGLVRRTLVRTGYDQGPAATLALIAALLWELHPLQTESVTYIVQRAESLMGLFYLLTLYCFVRSADAPAGSVPWSILAVVACLLGMASKEVMVSAPLIVVLYDRTFVSGSFRAAWRRHHKIFAALATTWILLAAEVYLTAGRGRTAGYGSQVPWRPYAWAQFRAIAHYLRLCVWPHPLIFDYGTKLDWNSSGAWPCALLVASLVVAAAFLAVRRPALGFCGAAFFAVLAPTSSVVPIATQVMAEHRMYLPLAVVTVLAVLGLNTLRLHWFGRGRAAGSVGWAVTIAAAVALAAGTFARNRTYADDVSLWAETARADPSNVRATENYACALMESKRWNEAVLQFEAVLRRDPRYPLAQRNLANCLVGSGRSDEAIGHYVLSVEGPDAAQRLRALGDRWAKQPSDRGYAIAAYRAALRCDPTDAETHFNLGNALAAVSREMPQAAAEFRAAVRLKPGFAAAHYNLALALLALPGHAAEAKAELQVLLHLQPDNQNARQLLASLASP